MKLLDKLKGTEKANARFKIYYQVNNWSLKIPLEDFLTQDFRYQLGVFLDYLYKENIGITVALNGYVLHAVDNTVFPKDELHSGWLYTVTDDGLIIIDAKSVEHEPQVTMVAHKFLECYKHGVAAAFNLIHVVNRGFNTEFDKNFIKL